MHFNRLFALAKAGEWQRVEHHLASMTIAPTHFYWAIEHGLDPRHFAHIRILAAMMIRQSPALVDEVYRRKLADIAGCRRELTEVKQHLARFRAAA